MQTALHIRALVAELNNRLPGGKIVSTEFYKKERATYIFVRVDRTVWALAFVYHPAGSGSVLLPGRKGKPETNEKPWPMFSLEGAIVGEVKQEQLDRVFSISLTMPDSTKSVLMFEAIGPNGNIWLLDSVGRKVGTLRKRDFESGDKYEFLKKPETLDLTEFSVEKLTELLRRSQSSSLVNVLDKGIGGFNRTMAIEAVSRADLDFSDITDLTETDIDNLYRTINDLAGRFSLSTTGATGATSATSATGYLYATGNGYEAYPFKLKSRDEAPEKMKSLSLALFETIIRRKSARVEDDERKVVLQAITKAIRRLEKRIDKLKSDISEAADFEKYKKIGDLLSINRDIVKKGKSSIRVDDIYSIDGATIEIKLDPAKTAQDNIERYFKRHRKGREGLKLLKRRLEISGAEVENLRSIGSELERDFEQAKQHYASDLASLLPKESTRRENLPRLPYREQMLPSGLTIYVGRDGADNDRTTFEFARPYELWFHAQQCAGSHVVIKFPNKSFVPSKQEIEETAAVAAFHSKARNDSLVPVIYTQRRYVRKPRKAKAGLVTVEREKSLMVRPDKME
ncbi:MAG: NFACT family protein [candidate division Zixibacteria bacterium]